MGITGLPNNRYKLLLKSSGGENHFLGLSSTTFYYSYNQTDKFRRVIMAPTPHPKKDKNEFIYVIIRTNIRILEVRRWKKQ
jgi:hypothetical protein